MSRVLKNKDNQVTQKYKNNIHDGIDLVGYKNAIDYIVAHSNGEVMGVRSNYKTTDKSGNSYGNYVKIKHENGYYTLYAHLKYGSVTVQKGDKVSKGQVIGYMGATGHATGAHLHFEVRNTSDKKIDPTSYINDNLPLAKEDITSECKFKVGDKVLINGALYVSSSASVATGKISNKITYITRVAKDALHPYNTTGDLGWMDENDIRLYKENSEMLYTVQKGDNLTKIAEKYNTTWQKIYEDNKAIIGDDPDFLKVGIVLTIN